MKISNSKKELARIINENGGWRDGAEWAAQDRYDMGVDFYARQPRRDAGDNFWHLPGRGYSEAKLRAGALVTNWHQTILSREEYFHRYPAPDADVAIAASFNPCVDGFEVGGVIAPHTEYLISEYNVAQYTPRITEGKPTIEQLAADYRNAKNYAERKQQEADAAKADAEAKLAELVAAGKALGLVLSATDTGPELVITDWRDLRVGDVIEYVDGRNKNRVGMVGRIDSFDLYNAGTDRPVRMVSDNGQVGWPTKWRFIRRPSEDGANA